jgi:hypothetical protein
MHLYVDFETCILPPLNSIFKNPSKSPYQKPKIIKIERAMATIVDYSNGKTMLMSKIIGSSR